MATRKEHITRVNKARSERKKRLVLDLINGLFVNEDYKKSTGSWNYTKIAKDTGVHRDTVAKIIKKYENKTNT